MVIIAIPVPKSSSQLCNSGRLRSLRLLSTKLEIWDLPGLLDPIQTILTPHPAPRPIGLSHPIVSHAEFLASASEIREVTGEVNELTHQFGLWLSLVERLPRVQEAAGSNPASPIKYLAFGKRPTEHLASNQCD